ncbi:MAG TPA: trans-aconitate 2-methyltransferase [Methylocystis sp.]|nr:trans-aconitate 2-methyltransferase [Methylocystis sp.]
MTDWSSALYLKFERERTRAARDLLSAIPPFEPRTVYDLGCGPGNSTELLAATFPNAEIEGVDYSDDMLVAARKRVSRAAFVKQGIEDWRPSQDAGLIFANAALQFVADHDRLMPRLASYLAKGGWLAVQMPHNIHEISHALMRMLAADGPWADRLVPIAKTRPVIGGVEDYYRLLRPASACFEIWQTTYVHALDGPKGIVDWFEGSGLRPFLEPLSPWERETFLARYERELAAAYPVQPDGKVLLRYPRLFLIAQR